MDTDFVTSGAAATRLGHGVQSHHLRNLANRREIPHQRAGHILLFRLADLPTIKSVCAQHGYYREESREVVVA